MGTRAQPVVLVTGSTDGIGRETALQLARRGAKVVLHGRSPERLEKARKDLERAVGRPMPEPVLGDLASLESVRGMVRALDERGTALDVLVNNAGIFRRKKELSADGLELTMAVNHFAPFLLTHLVLAGPSGKELRRVVNVSSMAHRNGTIDLRDPTLASGRFEPYAAYAASKLANVLFTVEFSRRLVGRGVAVNALHPGVVGTKLLTQGFGAAAGQDSVEDAAASSVMLALDPAGERATGKYFAYRREAPMSAAASDEKLSREFYEASAKVVGVEPLPG
ncbi:MAG TPA: SDR family oxidoreductase [Myxococcales bacterium]